MNLRIRNPLGAALFLAMILMAFLPLLPAHAASADLYTAADVVVDIKAASAAAGRDEAILRAQKDGLRKMLIQLAGEESGKKLADGVSDSTLAGLVRDFEITAERAVGTRYRGTFSVRYHPEKIRALMRGQGAAFTDRASPPMLMLPLVRQGARLVLFEQPTAWHRIWQEQADYDGIVPLKLARGDVDDITKLDAQQALDGDGDALDPLAASYKADGTIVALAEANATGGSLFNPKAPLTLTWQRLDKGRSTVWYETLTLPPAEEGMDETAWLRRGRELLRQSLADSWRQSGGGRSVYDSPITLQLPVKSLGDWLALKDHLEHNPEITLLTLRSLSRTAVQVDVLPRYDMEDLASSLRALGITLVQQEANLYLAERGAADSAKPPAMIIPDALPTEPMNPL